MYIFIIEYYIYTQYYHRYSTYRIHDLIILIHLQNSLRISGFGLLILLYLVFIKMIYYKIFEKSQSYNSIAKYNIKFESKNKNQNIIEIQNNYTNSSVNNINKKTEDYILILIWKIGNNHNKLFSNSFQGLFLHIIYTIIYIYIYIYIYINI